MLMHIQVTEKFASGVMSQVLRALVYCHGMKVPTTKHTYTHTYKHMFNITNYQNTEHLNMTSQTNISYICTYIYIYIYKQYKYYYYY